MRDDKLVSPVISSYAIGGDAPSPRRGAGFALPVIVILGTASVAAIVSVSFDDDPPIVANQRASGGDSAPELSAAARPGGKPSPNLSVRLDAPLLDAASGQAEPPAQAEPKDLPMLSVLQPRARTAVARPVAPSRADPPAVRTVRPQRLAVPTADASSPPPSDCTAGCVEAESFQAAAAPASGIAQLDAKLSEANVPLAADDHGELGSIPDRTEALAANAALATADPAPPVELVTDSRPAQLDTTESDLVASGPELSITEIDPSDALPTDLAIPEAEPSGSGELVATETEPPAPTAGAQAAVADSAAESLIPQHLARIGERYAGVPATGPAPADRSAMERATGEAEQPALVETGVPVSLGETAGSNVIVHDDELVAIRLGELVSLLEDRLDHPLYVWLSSSAAASKFVTAETLAAAGIRTRYDPQRRQLVISTTGE